MGTCLPACAASNAFFWPDHPFAFAPRTPPPPPPPPRPAGAALAAGMEGNVLGQLFRRGVGRAVGAGCGPWSPIRATRKAPSVLDLEEPRREQGPQGTPPGVFQAQICNSVSMVAPKSQR